MTKVITKFNYEIALDADQTRTQVVHRNHLVENFPPDNELTNLLSNYEKPFNDDKTEHFCNEYAKCRLSQLNQPINSFVERQHLNDYLPIFPDTCGPSRMDTTIKSPVKDNRCHSTRISQRVHLIWYSAIISSHSSFISIGITSHNKSTDYT